MPNDDYIENLESAFIDILDGSSEWWSIQEATGLSDKRCMEISDLFNDVMAKYETKHGLK